MLKQKIYLPVALFLCTIGEVSAGTIEGREAENVIYNGEIINPSTFDDDFVVSWVKFKKRIYYCYAFVRDRKEPKIPEFLCYYSDK
jgi:hypothetical protein